MCPKILNSNMTKTYKHHQWTLQQSKMISKVFRIPDFPWTSLPTRICSMYGLFTYKTGWFWNVGTSSSSMEHMDCESLGHPYCNTFHWKSHGNSLGIPGNPLGNPWEITEILGNCHGFSWLFPWDDFFPGHGHPRHHRWRLTTQDGNETWEKT